MRIEKSKATPRFRAPSEHSEMTRMVWCIAAAPGLTESHVTNDQE